MSDLMSEFRETMSLRASFLVKRWHVMPTIREQTVGEHSGQAVQLLLMLHPDPSMSLVKALLWHDTSERVVGDVPAPAKRAHPEFCKFYEAYEERIQREMHPSTIVELMPSDHRWLKAIDVLELVLHMGDEILLGSKHAVIVSKRARKYLRDSADTPAEVSAFLDAYEAFGHESFA